jgi:hypothetical protein
MTDKLKKKVNKKQIKKRPQDRKSGNNQREEITDEQEFVRYQRIMKTITN